MSKKCNKKKANVSKKVAKKLNSFYRSIPGLAKTVGFTKRKSVIIAIHFIISIVKAQLEYGNPTLQNYASVYELETDISVNRQAISKRIMNTKITDLIKLLITQLILDVTSSVIPDIFKKFNSVYAVDSTVIELPKCLAKYYPGYGGNASISSMKIQLMYNVLNGSYKHFELTGARTNDQSYGLKYIKHLKKNDLLLFDLGYACVELLHKIIEKGSYFVCRFADYNWKVFYPNDPMTKINLQQILKKNRNCNIEMNVLISERKVPVRLVCFPLQPQEYKKRQQSYIENCTKKGREVNSQRLEFLKWSIMITNADEQLIPTKRLYNIYLVRWQIELIFKFWKSKVKIDDLKIETKERLEFEIYAKLLTVLLFQTLTNSLLATDIPILNTSYIKCFSEFKIHSKNILDDIDIINQLTRSIQKYYKSLQKNGCKTSSKSRPTTIKKLQAKTLLDRNIKYHNNHSIKVLIQMYLEGNFLRTGSRRGKGA